MVKTRPSRGGEEIRKKSRVKRDVQVRGRYDGLSSRNVREVYEVIEEVYEVIGEVYEVIEVIAALSRSAVCGWTCRPHFTRQ